MTKIDDAALKQGEEMAKDLPSPPRFVRPADVLAADATLLTPFHLAKGKGTLKTIHVVPGAAVTFTNATLTVTRYRAGSGVTVRSVTSGSWPIMVATSLGALSNTAIQDGDILGLTLAKTGGGILLPPLLVLVTIQAG